MDDTQKLLRGIINGQSALKSDILGEVSKLRKDMNTGFEDVNKQIKNLDVKLTSRIDAVGKQSAYLEDDAPTRDEFEKLVKRVDKIQKTFAS